MAIRIIRKDNDPILRKTAKKVDKVDDKIRMLLDDMAETMYHEDGVGLAAPQIGILKRIIVVDIGDGLIELINPEIIHEEGEETDLEGCLSLPGRNGKVKRPKKVVVKGINRDGKEIIVEGENLLARALCHEIDHLNGVLFIDKLIETE